MDKINKINKTYLVLLAIFVVILAFILHFRRSNKKEPIVLVTDNSSFFTVASCVSKYVTYVQKNDIENIMILLNSKYVKKNNIDAGNLSNYVGIIPENSSFVARKMYYEKVGKTTYKYYVYGYLMDNNINSSQSTKTDMYVIVYMHEDGMTYAIEPYDGEIFNK